MMKILCLIAIVLGLGTGVAYADLYRVSDIPISAELDSAKEARKAAIENGEMDAFWALMKKMVVSDYQQQIPMPAETDIHSWVQTVSLTNEKNTATKYMADLSVRFDDKQIQGFLTQNNIPFLTKDLPDMVLIPVVQTQGDMRTLEEENPLYAYLSENPVKNDLWKAILPAGDLEEIVLTQRALGEENKEELTKISHKYSVPTAMVIQVRQQGPYVIADISYVPEQPALDNRVEMIATTGQMKSVLPNLWQKIVSEQEKKWRELKTQNFEAQITFWVQIPIRKLSEWTALSHRLKKVDFIEALTVRGFRPNEVWISFGFKGTSAELNRQLRPLGLTLEMGDKSGFWILKSARGEE